MPEPGEQDQVLEYREQWSRLSSIETAQLYVGTRRVHGADARAVSKKQIWVIEGGAGRSRSDELRSSLSSSRRGPPCYFWRPRRARRRIKYGMQSAMMMPTITSVD